MDGAGPALADRRHLHHRRAGRGGRGARLHLHARHRPGLLPQGNAQQDHSRARLQPGTVSSAVAPTGPAVAAPGRRSWPIRSGTVPTLAEGFDSRPETAPSLAAALPAGAAVALVPDRTADLAADLAAMAGPVAAPDAPDWLRSSGKTQLAAAWAERLWQSGSVELLVWIDATSRDSVLSGYAAATADVTGRDQVSSSESVAAQFL